VSPVRVARPRGGATSASARRRHSWLELVQTSGPFLTLPVLDRVLPDGPPAVARTVRAELRKLAADALAARGASREVLVRAVLGSAFGWGEHLKMYEELPDALAEVVPGHTEVLRPSFGFYAEDEGEIEADGADEEEAGEPEEDGEDAAEEALHAGGTRSGSVMGPRGRRAGGRGPWKLLGLLSPWGAHPLARATAGGWAASPVERLAVLLRARDVPVGVVTDGRWWALVWAPRGGTTAAGVWDAGTWGEEPEALAGLVALLARSRFLAEAPADRLPALFEESLERQEEVTEALGRQVREAVELLVRAFDSLDAVSKRELLAGVSDDDLYDAAVTVMMRVVFCLFAEERRLLPSDDATYEASYSVARLVEQLEHVATLSGEAALEHRSGAWHRLLAVSRALHAGVAHEDLRLPAYGGDLFDPDRYPWLEGRRDGDEPLDGARPPEVDDRTVLQMLRAVQYVEVGGERRRLTFRALDVEQVGYVYEGLLELEVRSATEAVLALQRPKDYPRRIKAPAEVPVSEALAAVSDLERPRLERWLMERTGWAAKKAAAALDAEASSAAFDALLAAVGGDLGQAKLLAPLGSALRLDERGRPVVFLPGSRYVAPSSRRAATGTHYTPRSLAEDVAGNALEPLVYRPGPLETADRSAWRLRPSSEILALRVADIAMGSGAFLVAACRYLADRLVEAWDAEGREDAMLAVAARRGLRAASDAEVGPVLLEARRLVADHCLYGVDINPLAVEMAKLSLWLVTMDRERPFGFLDDRFRCGDSLLGLTSVAQLEAVHLDPAERRRRQEGTLFDVGDYVRPVLQQAADLRKQITAQPVVTVRDIEHKQRLLAESERLTVKLTVVANAITGAGLAVAGKRPADVSRRFELLVDQVAPALSQGGDHLDLLARKAERGLQDGRPAGTVPRVALHWPVAFPEVFADCADPGFDAIIGNPPFLGGQKITGHLGDDYRAWLQKWDGNGVKGSADLVAFFVLRAARLLSSRGQLGYIATNTLVQGDTLEVGLLQATSATGGRLTVRRAESSHKWPSRSANLEIVTVWATRAPMSSAAHCWFDGEEVPHIGPDLEPVGEVAGRPYRLAENEGVAFQGSNVLGLGFTMPPEQATAMIERDPRYRDVLHPYVIGKDLNQRLDCSASRWVINFHDWPLERCEKYPEALAIVRRLVKPERDRNRRAQRRERWWIYGERAPELYEAIAGLDHVLAISLVSNVVQPVRVPTGQVFAHRCAVFALDDFANLAILSSNAHFVWTLRYSSTLETRINYAPTDVFLTFPRPEPTPELEELGRTLDAERRRLMLSRAWGLTTTYNHVHDPADTDPAIVLLRQIHNDIDHAVLAAYGWSDLDPEVGHHPTKIGTRWTVSPEARFALLDRLLAENHRRYSLERG
jgi:hypothetical protein